MNHSRLHNPKYVGPGLWYGMHIDAANAKTSKDKEAVIKRIRILQNNFPCQECKVHFANYLTNHPPEETIKGGPDSLFLWTVNFHNAVNYRLGKPQITFEEAKSIYIDQDVFCTKSSCEDSDEEVVIEDKKENKPKKTPKLIPADMVNIYRNKTSK
jgi:hypothetical protein